MKKLKFINAIVGILMSTTVLIGCAGNATEKGADNKSGTEAKTIVIGTGNAFKPYCYLDESGNLSGYEIEVLKEINKKLPQYTFEFNQLEFKNILLSLESNKVDVGAHQFEKNPERESKYLFGTESYTNFILRITVGKDRKDINSIKDLEGKKVQTSAGSNDAYILEQYNKEHNNAINLVYTSSSDAATTIKNIEDGRIDAFVSIKRIVDSYNQTYGDKLKTVGDPIATSNTYYVFRKDDINLQREFDKALKELKDDGTLAKISIKILGGDYTTNE
ncbi:L-cystine-binding protein TcyK precursor [Clostridium puniceum]|uniref:L-cystine-binding protein TcyK n=1 Tax=Clostridium puniceum TaxID=29367 RepID=A0A1S8TPN1_9CLOT|nr:transporter substrate-binding domain-containing protein [Clostridium puniceum]OOM79599.1 L-cystine-binding protein TcyK precursor [Clostridium puniceum]